MVDQGVRGLAAAAALARPQVQTPASLRDATMRARASALPGAVQPGLWEDWAPVVRGQAEGRGAAAKL